MVRVDDIKEFWVNTEINSIVTLDEIGFEPDRVIQSAINDASVEIEPIIDNLSKELADLYIKRLTVNILLSRANVPEDSVELPLKEGEDVRSLIRNKQSSKTILSVNGGMKHTFDLEDY